MSSYRICWTRSLLLTFALALWGCDGDVAAGSGGGGGMDAGDRPTGKPGGAPCVVDGECASGQCADSICAFGAGVDAGGVQCPGGRAPSECGNCDATCRLDGAAGQGGLDPEQGTGVVRDPSGAITLETDGLARPDQYIWISNTGQGTVSKVNTESYLEEARYTTAGGGQGNDPSRTSVNSYGDVFVGNRAWGSVTKVAGSEGRCADRDADGAIRTSSGPADVLAWGEDECVLWETELCEPGACLIRAVAAQDVADASSGQVRSYVWAGDFRSSTIWKLDAETGEILLTIASATRPYGFALDRSKNLWISGPNWGHSNESRKLGRLDTTRCVDEASCAFEPGCEGAGGDQCVQQFVVSPDQPYGLTVDFKQRVWLGGASLKSYDPAKPAGERFTKIDTPEGRFIHGITADLDGFIWAAASDIGRSGNEWIDVSSQVLRASADDPSSYAYVDGTEGNGTKGIAVDLAGKVWAISLTDDRALVIDPGSGLNDGRVTQNVTGFVVPYVYSDMTGSQLRFASDQIGSWSHIFEACAPAERFPETEWGELRWVAEVPDPARGRITLRARAARTTAGLSEAEWFEVGSSSTGGGEVFDLGAALEARGEQGFGVVEVEAQLQLEREVGIDPMPPRLISLDITKSCAEISG